MSDTPDCRNARHAVKVLANGHVNSAQNQDHSHAVTYTTHTALANTKPPLTRVLTNSRNALTTTGVSSYISHTPLYGVRGVRREGRDKTKRNRRGRRTPRGLYTPSKATQT